MGDTTEIFVKEIGKKEKGVEITGIENIRILIIEDLHNIEVVIKKVDRPVQGITIESQIKKTDKDTEFELVLKVFSL